MTSKAPIIHWGGGAAYKPRPNSRNVTFMGMGFPVCCAGDRSVRIANSGWQRFSEKDAGEVTCKRCLEIMKKRLDPGPNGIMRIPELPGYPPLKN